MAWQTCLFEALTWHGAIDFAMVFMCWLSSGLVPVQIYLSSTSSILCTLLQAGASVSGQPCEKPCVELALVASPLQ